MTAALQTALDAALDTLFEADPVLATFAGDHRFDAKLAAQDPDGRADATRRLATARAAIAAVPQNGLSVSDAVDRQLMIDELDARARVDDVVRPSERDPGRVLDDLMFGVYLLLQREFAPLEERLARVVDRLRAAPQALADARRSLADARGVPRPWAETASEVVPGLPSFFGVELAARAAGMAIEKDVREAGRAAAEAAEAYGRDLQGRILPAAAGDFACGRTLFDFLLGTKHRLDLDADSLLALGKREIAEVTAEMERHASKLAPGKTWREVVDSCKENHPAAGDVVHAYAREMARARDFVREKDLAGFPPSESLDVVETPAFSRPFIPYAAYIAPAPFEKVQKGFFWVTPVDEDATEERRRQQLRDHCFFEIESVALHEGYPGHHLQLALANLVPSRVRRVLWTSVFAEGWALYCEQMMGEQGFYSDPRVRLLQLKARLWRGWRVVVDSGLHTRGMSFDDAVATMVREADLEEVNAVREVRRYSSSPTQPMSYTVGRHQILELQRDWRRAKPHATLREFHDALLAHGTVPFAFARKLMGLPVGPA